MAPTSIAFIDDHPILREALVNIFSGYPDYLIVGSGSRAADAVSIAEQQCPEVMIIELLIPGNALEAIARIRIKSPSMVIIVFSGCDRVDHACSALDAGANGYVLKGSPVAELQGAIVEAILGVTFVSPSLASKMITTLRRLPADDVDGQRFSVREEQIVRLLMKGGSNKAIAENLKISEKTVKHYMTLLMHKLNVRSRLEVVLAVQRLGQFSGHN